MIHCPNCGAEINNNQDCPYCGYKNPNQPQVQPQVQAQVQPQVQATASVPAEQNNYNTVNNISGNMKKYLIRGFIVIIILAIVVMLPKFLGNNSSTTSTNNGSESEKIKVSGIKEAYENATTETDDGNFYMPVEDVFKITGRGTVITGQVKSGTVKVGDTVTLLSSTKGERQLTVTGIEAFRKEKEEATKGDNIGVLLADITREEIERGDVIAAPNTAKLHKSMTVGVYLLPLIDTDVKEITNKLDATYYFNTADFTGKISIKGGSLKAEHESKDITLTLDNPVGIKTGQRFAIRQDKRTIGYGIVLGFND